MAHKANVGSAAPDFQLEGTDGAFRLSEHRGERVVLLFYPGDNTPVCTRQFCSYRDAGESFDALDATVVGISAQSVSSHEGFAGKHRLTVPLLADEGGRVARAYGMHAPVIGTRRGVVIVDEDGIVRFRHEHRLGLDYLSAEQLHAALDTLPARAG